LAFGIMDGIVTLVGVLLALFVANADRKIVMITTLAAAIADSTANAAGFHVAEEVGKKNTHSRAVRASLFSFIATFVTMMIPLIPILFFELYYSIPLAILIGLLILFLLGSITKNWKVGIEYFLIGAVAGSICYLVSHFIS
ncbi:MAG: hypothetical protein QXI58_07900, partial [Candidatus Micrarchaeia archaeon]